MTELEKHLLEALEHMQNEQTAQQNALKQMFEYTAGYAERQTSIQNVIREYQRDRPDPKREIEQLDTACKQLERANTELREATKQVEEMNRSYNNDIRLGR